MNESLAPAVFVLGLMVIIMTFAVMTYSPSSSALPPADSPATLSLTAGGNGD